MAISANAQDHIVTGEIDFDGDVTVTHFRKEPDGIGSHT